MKRGKKELQLYWRPNFVNQSELPDIKVVRTGFIINFISVILALCVVFSLLQREYRAYGLNQNVADLEARIRAAEPLDAENLKLSTAFRSSAQNIVEVEAFYDAPFLMHEFVLKLSAIKPDDLIFDSLYLSESVVKEGAKSVIRYNINITGDAKGLTVLNDFKKILEEADLLQIDGFQLEVNETLQGRDEKTGIFKYQMAIVLMPGGDV